MKNFFILIVSITIFGFAKSQIQGDISFGTDSTLEVVTWNIENFPKASSTTSRVIEIVNKLKVDFIALQEIKSAGDFNQVLQVTGMSGLTSGESYADLAILYNPDVIKNVTATRILTTYTCFTSSPFLVKFFYKNEEYYVINTHLKCCGDGIIDFNNTSDEEYRRYLSINYIKSYIDTYLSDKKVFIVGDMNDPITDVSTNNVFQSLINDSQNYRFADMEIAQGSSSYWSYPSWPSHLDHICITNELFPENTHKTIVVNTIRIDQHYSGGWYEYDNNISDHRPVGIRVYADSIATPPHSDTNSNVSDPTSTVCYPNPSQDIFFFKFPKAKFNSNISIYSVSGELVFESNLKEEQTSMIWNANSCKAGIYVVVYRFGKNVSIEKIILFK